jgi:hypothetical protein
MSANKECRLDIHAALNGGDPRSLGRTEEVVECVLCDKTRLDDLFQCVFDEDAIVRMRAGDALEKVCRAHPEWLVPYTDRILTEVADIQQPSVQWHVAQMIDELPLTAAQRRQAIAILKRNLESATDWIVLNDTLEVFSSFVRSDPTLQPYFVDQLRKHAQDSRKSVAKRATKLLETFSETSA